MSRFWLFNSRMVHLVFLTNTGFGKGKSFMFLTSFTVILNLKYRYIEFSWNFQVCDDIHLSLYKFSKGTLLHFVFIIAYFKTLEKQFWYLFLIIYFKSLFFLNCTIEEPIWSFINTFTWCHVLTSLICTMYWIHSS